MSAPSLTFDEIEKLINSRFGEFDVPCPVCSPHRQQRHRQLPVLHIWRWEPDYASFNCIHCEIHGYAQRNARNAVKDSQEYLRRRAEAERRDADDKQIRSRRAVEIWNQAVPIAGTLAERYLSNRGIDVDVLPDDMFHVLRWHPCCPWEHGTAPCLVALWTDAVTAEPKAIHRTALTPRVEKIDRMFLGPSAGCVIRLWEDAAAERGLVIGEGIETTLSAATNIAHRGTRLTPAWACGCSGNMRDFPVLAGIEALTILVDHDASGEGQDAAEMCSRRWCDVGREVVRLVPRIPGDFNDIVTRSRHDAA